MISSRTFSTRVTPVSLMFMQNQQRKDLNKLVSHLIQQMGKCFTNLNELTKK